MKPINNRAWFLVLPVLVLVAFSAVIPLMTVVNYSVQDSFGSNEFFWNGIYWFDDLLHSERMWDALGRQILFSAIVLPPVCRMTAIRWGDDALLRRGRPLRTTHCGGDFRQ